MEHMQNAVWFALGDIYCPMFVSCLIGVESKGSQLGIPAGSVDSNTKQHPQVRSNQDSKQIPCF